MLTEEEKKEIEEEVNQYPYPAVACIDALKIMSARNIGRIPIVQDDKILGIVTRTDILKVT